jgi:glutamate synthase domain-containing protein 3
MDKQLAGVKAAQERLKKARAEVESRLRVMLEAELGELVRARDVAVRKAHEAGVSKAAIKRALGTKDHATVQRILSGSDSTLGAVASGEQVVVVGANECVVNWLMLGGELVAEPVKCLFGFSEGELWVEPVAGEESSIVGLVREGLNRGDTEAYDVLRAVVLSVA